MFCCPVCNKRFENRKEMKEHARISRAHFPCDRCERVYRNLHVLSRHVEAKHSVRESPREGPLYRCRPCNKYFASQSSLSEHYRGSRQHPVCTECGRGFENQRACDEHQRQCSFSVYCHTCNSSIQKDDKIQHYLDSPNHPTCMECKVGFIDEIAFDQHCLRLHDIARCQYCKQHYSSVSGEDRARSAFTCPTCKNGTSTEQQQAFSNSPSPRLDIDKVLSQSYPPTQSISRLSTSFDSANRFFNQTGPTEFPSPKDSEKPPRYAVEVAQQWLKHSARNNTQNSLTSIPVSATSVASVVNVSAASQPNVEITTPSEILPSWYIDPPSPPPENLASPEVRTPIELDAIPTISPSPSTPVSQSVIAAASQDIWPPWPGPTRPRLPNIATRIGTRPNETVNSSVSTTLARDFVLLGLDTTNDSLLNTQAPDLSSPALRHNLTWNFDPFSNLETNDTRDVDQHWSPKLSSGYQKAVTRPTSVSPTLSTMTSTLNSGSGSHSDGRKSVTQDSSPSTSVSLHCRLCMTDPCIDPTATMCGHVFCGNCITESVIISPRCPVCQHAVLLYCLFKLDLSS
ncbi:hypothetical protein C8R42DRAFT_175920 [Lentinula raphanica]|nr:hypothetical protein C8R42DRAFT_175920 [Lentinula raphanica]